MENWSMTYPTLENPDPNGKFDDFDEEFFLNVNKGGLQALDFDSIDFLGVDQEKSGKRGGILSDFTNLLGHGYAVVRYNRQAEVWLQLFGWSPERDYPKDHIYHPDNR